MLFHSGQGASYFGKNLNNISLINNNAYASHNGSLLMPSGIQAGDLLLVSNTAGSGGASIPTITVLPGLNFTLISSVTGTYSISTSFYRQTSVMSYKIADGTEGGTTISSFTTSTGSAAILFHLRGNVKINSVTNTTFINTAIATEPPLYTAATTTGNALEIPYYMNGASNSVPSMVTSPTPFATNIAAAGIYASLAAGIWTSIYSASSYTFDSSDCGNMNTIIGGKLVLSN